VTIIFLFRCSVPLKAEQSGTVQTKSGTLQTLFWDTEICINLQIYANLRNKQQFIFFTKLAMQQTPVASKPNK
jgi:hypothetical protein